jgi:hypothetical protein
MPNILFPAGREGTTPVRTVGFRRWDSTADAGRPAAELEPAALPVIEQSSHAGVVAPIGVEGQSRLPASTTPLGRLLYAFMCRWFVNVPWLPRIDVLHM